MGTEELSTSQSNETQNKDTVSSQPLAQWLHITYMISLAMLVLGIVLLVTPALVEDYVSYTSAVQPYFFWIMIVTVVTNFFLLVYAIANKITANKRAALLSLFSLLLFQLTYFLFVFVYFNTCCVAE